MRKRPQEGLPPKSESCSFPHPYPYPLPPFSILVIFSFSLSSILRCVVVGDGGVGKTSLLSTFATGVFPEDYVPTGGILDPIIFPLKCSTTMLLRSRWAERAMSSASLTRQVRFLMNGNSQKVCICCHCTRPEGLKYRLYDYMLPLHQVRRTTTGSGRWLIPGYNLQKYSLT